MYIEKLIKIEQDSLMKKQMEKHLLQVQQAIPQNMRSLPTGANGTSSGTFAPLMRSKSMPQRSSVKSSTSSELAEPRGFDKKVSVSIPHVNSQEILAQHQNRQRNPSPRTQGVRKKVAKTFGF